MQLILGDCLEVMRTFPDKSANVLITDPPYGIGKNNIIHGSRTWRNSKGRDSSGDNFSWDNTRRPDCISLAVSLAQEAIVFGGNYYTDILPPSPGWIIWDKQNSGNFSSFEMIWTSYKRAARIFRYMWNGMIKAQPETRYHPTQKPLILMKWIIDNYTKPNDIILDPFMGSGTTGVACVQTGRYFIGIEIDPGYFAIAERRIKEAREQFRLSYDPSGDDYYLDCLDDEEESCKK